MNDDELLELFSAFDDVSASDTLQSSTLDFIMGAAAAAPGSAEAAEAAETPKVPEAEGTPGQAVKVAATRGAKPRLRSRWRAMRTAAVAACLALALTGGAAYAYPASTVLVTQGDTTIELHVNVFGQVLSASANDDEIQSLIDQMGLVNTRYSDSVNRVSSSLKESNPEVPVEVVMNGQAIETPEEALQSTDEAVSADEDGRHAPAADGRANLKNEPAAAEDEAVSEASSSTASATYLPEPGGVTVGDGGSGKSDGGKRAADRESDASESTDSGDSGDSGDNGSAGGQGQVVIVEPTQPVVVDEDPGSGQDAQPVVEPPNNPKSDVQDDEEVVYDTTRPPKYHSESRTATDPA